MGGSKRKRKASGQKEKERSMKEKEGRLTRAGAKGRVPMPAPVETDYQSAASDPNDHRQQVARIDAGVMVARTESEGSGEDGSGDESSDNSAEDTQVAQMRAQEELRRISDGAYVESEADSLEEVELNAPDSGDAGSPPEHGENDESGSESLSTPEEADMEDLDGTEMAKKLLGHYQEKYVSIVTELFVGGTHAVAAAQAYSSLLRDTQATIVACNLCDSILVVREDIMNLKSDIGSVLAESPFRGQLISEKMQSGVAKRARVNKTYSPEGQNQGLRSEDLYDVSRMEMPTGIVMKAIVPGKKLSPIFAGSADSLFEGMEPPRPYEDGRVKAAGAEGGRDLDRADCPAYKEVLKNEEKYDPVKRYALPSFKTGTASRIPGPKIFKETLVRSIIGIPKLKVREKKSAMTPIAKTIKEKAESLMQVPVVPRRLRRSMLVEEAQHESAKALSPVGERGETKATDGKARDCIAVRKRGDILPRPTSFDNAEAMVAVFDHQIDVMANKMRETDISVDYIRQEQRLLLKGQEEMTKALTLTNANVKQIGERGDARMDAVLQAIKDLELRSSTARLCDQRAGPPGFVHNSTAIDAQVVQEPGVQGQGQHIEGSELGWHGQSHGVVMGDAAARRQMIDLDRLQQGVGADYIQSNESRLAQRCPRITNHTKERSVAMMGNMVASEKIQTFSDEDKGVLLADWISTIMYKKDNHVWSDEQTARLIVECCRGRARQALDLLTSVGRTHLHEVLRTLEKEFYSEAKQSAALMAFGKRKRLVGETERKYAKELGTLAYYAYKDDTQAHIDRRVREQFLSGLRSNPLGAYLSLFCKEQHKVTDLVSRAEAFKAAYGGSATIKSDPEDESAGPVSVAYVQAGKTFAQTQKVQATNGTSNTGWKRGPGPDLRSKKNRQPRAAAHSGGGGGGKPPIKPSECTGKCCYSCGKYGHLIKDCKTRNWCAAVILNHALQCEDPAQTTCRCECGQHHHHSNAEDHDVALMVVGRYKPEYRPS